MCKWLTPGLSVKRWLLLLALGIALLSVGLSFMLRELYPLPRFFYYVTLQFVPRIWRAVLLGLLGLGAIALALLKLNEALLAPFLANSPRPVVDTVYQYRQRERGPKIVAIGGGHGLAVLLLGLKRYTTNISVIVTVADDGGSSGDLRRQLGVLPPGDFRNCIAALADDEALVTQLFQYRFPTAALDSHASHADKAPRDGRGHSFGNLFISAMAEVTGSFEEALVESSRVLATRGHVLPSTLQDVTLMADLYKGETATTAVSRVAGESHITDAGGVISRVYLMPDDAPAYPPAVRALLEADLIVAGPGSLYTSVLPNLLVRDIAAAIAASRALKVYVCNVATQRGETDGYSAGDHIAALERHVRPTVEHEPLFSLVLANDNLEATFDAPPGIEHVTPGDTPPPYRIVTADLLDRERPWRHESDKLAKALLDLLRDRSRTHSLDQ